MFLSCIGLGGATLWIDGSVAIAYVKDSFHGPIVEKIESVTNQYIQRWESEYHNRHKSYYLADYQKVSIETVNKRKIDLLVKKEDWEKYGFELAPDQPIIYYQYSHVWQPRSEK